MQYWINTISRAHVLLGVAGGFTQADHGRNTRLRQLEHGDWLVFYSPRTEFRAGQSLQRFTAIGRISDDVRYQVQMSESFHPWRRTVQFLESHEVLIQPLVTELTFIADKQHWGFPFRTGLFKVGQEDFGRIAAAMGVMLGKQDVLRD